jgi:peptidoglycan/LPS O-acetylase OafA/YrhL
MRPLAMSPAVSRFIHLARWVAALFVVLEHVGTTFVSVPDIMRAPHGPLVYVWWFFSVYAFAHEAVVVFFVLSGFLVGGLVLGRRAETTPWLRNYAIDRFVRIYIVLLPALALTFILDAIGRRVFASSGIYDMPFLQGHYDLWLLIPNILNWQGIWFATLGTNTPLWSLGMEFWYYIVFPLLLLPFMAAYPRHMLRVGGLAAALVFLSAVPSASYFLFGFCIWILGACARRMKRPPIRSKWLALALFLVASIVIRLAVREHILMAPPAMYLTDALNALLFANLLLTLQFDTGEGFRLTRWAGHERLAAFSYTLYAVHVPMAYWVWGLTEVAFGQGWRQQQATLLHYGVAIATVVLLVAAAWAFSRLTEANTATVRRWLRGRFAGRAKPAATGVQPS